MSVTVPVNVPCPSELGEQVCDRVDDANQYIGGLFDVLARLGVQGRYCRDTIDRFVNEIQPIVDAMQTENAALKAENSDLKKQVTRARQSVAAKCNAVQEEAAKRQEDLANQLNAERDKFERARKAYEKRMSKYRELEAELAQYTQHFDRVQGELHQLRTANDRLQNDQDICSQQVTRLEEELALRRQAAIIMNGIVHTFTGDNMAAHMRNVRRYAALQPKAAQFFEDAFKMHQMAIGIDPLDDTVVAAVLNHMNMKAEGGKLTELLASEEFLRQFYQFLEDKIVAFDRLTRYKYM